MLSHCYLDMLHLDFLKKFIKNILIFILNIFISTKAISTEELEKYFDMCQYNEEFYHTQQLVEKIMINSLYGAVGKEFFPLFNLEMARAITGNGRYLVKNTANMIEERLQELNPHSGKYILYCDK